MLSTMEPKWPAWSCRLAFSLLMRLAEQAERKYAVDVYLPLYRARQCEKHWLKFSLARSCVIRGCVPKKILVYG